VLHGTPVEIDVSQLSYTNFELSGAGEFSATTDPVSFMLIPGNHGLSLATGRSSEPHLDFRVEADGTLQFAPALDPFVGGRGTRALVLHGTPVEIDVSQLSYTNFELSGAGEFSATTDPNPLILMPGGHEIIIANGSGPEFGFTVQADGTVQFDPSLDSVVDGRATSSMVLHGTRIEIDITNLSYNKLELRGVGEFSAMHVAGPLVLMPGGHGIVVADGRGPEFDFTVQADGTLQFQPSLDWLVAGRGTRALVLYGTRIEIDISELSYSGYLVGTSENLDMSGPTSFAVMPGSHSLTMHSGRSPQPTLDFTVQANGTVQFSPSLDTLVAGRGTRMMVLHGVRIDIDVSELSYLGFALIGAHGFTDTTDPVSFVLMPGRHGLMMPTSRSPEPGIDFTVETDGTLQFDPSFDPYVAGRGTRTIVLHGVRIDIDVSKLSYIGFNLAGAGGFGGSPDPIPFVLMPGSHLLTMTTSNSPEPRLEFSLHADGTLRFDPSLDSLIGGRGTRAIVLHGARIDIDARASATPFVVEGLATKPIDQILAANLMPGAHRFRSPKMDFIFHVTPSLTVDYDTALDRYVVGRHTTTLFVGDASSYPDEALLTETSATAHGSPDTRRGPHNASRGWLVGWRRLSRQFKPLSHGGLE
jgi:hypothetical protein